MLTNTKRRQPTMTQARFHACAACASVPPELVKKAKQIAADKAGNAFLIETMRKRAAKSKGIRYAVAPDLLRELEKAGERLERDPGDNYALALVTALILNKVYLAAQSGDNHYKKHFQRDKTGKRKKVLFKSEFFCQSEMADHVPVYETEKGFVRAKIHSCGKAWSCPVCASKIAIRRNLEIKIILEKARNEGMTSYMITLTAPHYSHQRLLYCSERMQKAYAHFDNSKSMKALREKYNVFGKIKTMETMLGGRNGWHNHFHLVYIFNQKIDEVDEIIILDAIKKQWAKSCAHAGILCLSDGVKLDQFLDHAVSLKKDFDPDYLAKQSEEWKKEHGVSEKWGAAEELTFSHIKKGEGSFTAFGYIARLARLAAIGCLTNAEAERGAELYIEYCCALKGRSMIQFSKGLREWACLKEKTDKKICKEQNDHGEMIGGFDKEQHVFVRRHALWKPFKKLLMADQEIAIEEINKIFKENGLRPFYSPAALEHFIYCGDDDDFPEFSVPAPIETPPPKLAESAEMGIVRPKIEHLKLFALI